MTGLLLSNMTLSAVQAEATRAHLRHKAKSMLYGTDERRLRILVEEVGEVAREMNDADIEERPVDRDKIVKELIQSAAMCLTWVEALEGHHPEPAFEDLRAHFPPVSGMDTQAATDNGITG